MSSRGYLPPVADRNGELREQLEELQAEAGPDVSLADVIRRAIRFYMAGNCSMVPARHSPRFNSGMSFAGFNSCFLILLFAGD